jgi:DNA polymerase-1
MARTLLIDADVVAYNACFAVEQAIEFEPGYWTWHVSWDEVVEAFDNEVNHMVEALEADAFKLCLTDSEGNFRKDVLPSYKGARLSIRKPIVLKHFKQWLVDERQAYFKPGLEGDDVMGVLATHPSIIPGEKLVVSIDKDMRTVPGQVIRWGTDEAFIRHIEPAEADYWHLFQTLTGDTVDGFKGCPSIGPKKAEAILAPFLIEGKHPEFDLPGAWAAVVAAYEAKGLNEDDAIIQARCARILRASDYDFKNKEAILWSPPT